MDRTPEDIQDELLVLLSQEGDGDALRRLVIRWQPRLGRLAWRLTGEREAAADAVQEAWLAIARGLRRLDDPARFREWAFRIVSNKCADWLRRRIVRRNAASDVRAPAGRSDGPPVEADRTDEVARLRAAMAKLPGEQRALLALHYLEGLGLAEIARVFNVPQGTIKSRLFHVRERLRQKLERGQS